MVDRIRPRTGPTPNRTRRDAPTRSESRRRRPNVVVLRSRDASAQPRAWHGPCFAYARAAWYVVVDRRRHSHRHTNRVVFDRVVFDRKRTRLRLRACHLRTGRYERARSLSSSRLRLRAIEGIYEHTWTSDSSASRTSTFSKIRALSELSNATNWDQWRLSFSREYLIETNVISLCGRRSPVRETARVQSVRNYIQSRIN